MQNFSQYKVFFFKPFQIFIWRHCLSTLLLFCVQCADDDLHRNAFALYIELIYTYCLSFSSYVIGMLLTGFGSKEIITEFIMYDSFRPKSALI